MMMSNRPGRGGGSVMLPGSKRTVAQILGDLPLAATGLVEPADHLHTGRPRWTSNWE